MFRLTSGVFRSMSSIDEQLGLSVDIFTLCIRNAGASLVGLLTVKNVSIGMGRIGMFCWRRWSSFRRAEKEELPAPGIDIY